MIEVIKILIVACQLHSNSAMDNNNHQRKCHRELVSCADKMFEQIQTRNDMSPSDKKYHILKECLKK